MKKYILIGSLAAFCAVGAISTVSAKDIDGATLLKQAKDAGLVAMPTGEALKKRQIELANHNKLAPGYKDKMTPAQVELGKQLFFDPRISTSGIISCNTCHNLGLGGVDGVPAAVGNRWTPNPHGLNSPTVYNSVFNSRQFWDGRAHHLSDQAQGPIQASNEMAADPKVVIEKILSMPGYVSEFQKAYGKNVKIDFDLVTDTIAMFEETLVTPDSKFDKFMSGDTKALNEKEKEGLELFVTKGCAACHNGINLGGQMRPFQLAGKYKFDNVGDFRGNKEGLVKAPTLRNILQTAPYFHNGQFWDVKDAIKEMGRVQLGIKITNDEAQKIEAFFATLTGKKPVVTYPEFPVSTTKTPRPQF
ncbi:cytochrome-c peroxidase [Helicobacter sp. 11S02629-2]|uniref:cytochrome-c peroxidase n=1 Tax=Helicobacter sp. 11S02629-2 TaxID=1476195 RepID=UPI000BA528B2|nr:cytochrome-c peroxidase [Helicobacter sp. 11S02629-2]PAF44340.1 cytochrome C biogenesis protein CcsA [Helicobacter sp. 11S02629-2]